MGRQLLCKRHSRVSIANYCDEATRSLLGNADLFSDDKDSQTNCVCSDK